MICYFLKFYDVYTFSRLYFLGFSKKNGKNVLHFFFMRLLKLWYDKNLCFSNY